MQKPLITLLTAITAELRGRAFLDLLPMPNWRAGLAWTDSRETLLIAAITLLSLLSGILTIPTVVFGVQSADQAVINLVVVQSLQSDRVQSLHFNEPDATLRVKAFDTVILGQSYKRARHTVRILCWP